MNRRTKIVFGGILLFIISIFSYITFPLKSEMVYYIPECNIYIRKEIKSWAKFGYIYFGKDSLSVWSSDDYVKLYNIVDHTILDIYNNSFNDTTYLTSDVGISEMKQTHFKFVVKKILDPIMFNPTEKKAEYDLKPGFNCIRIYDFGEDVAFFNDTSSVVKIPRID